MRNYPPGTVLGVPPLLVLWAGLYQGNVEVIAAIGSGIYAYQGTL